MRWGLAAGLIAAAVLTAVAARAADDKPAIGWVELPGGVFAMGSDRQSDSRPIRQVSVKPFRIAKSPVTNKQYRACVAAGACAAIDEKCELPPFAGDDQPAVCVSWEAARTFSRWIGGRLPSEAEWEYAARSGGKLNRRPWGDEEATCARAVLDEGGYGCGKKASWPVCSKPSGNTEQGLCDMAGNVYQWMEDDYETSYKGAPTDGSARENPAGKFRVVRGGSFSRKADFLETTLRAASRPGNSNVALGFRPVLDLAPADIPR